MKPENHGMKKIPSTENILKNSLLDLTPDDFESIASKCDSGEGSVYIIGNKPKNNALRAAGSLAAALVLVLSGLFAYARIDYAGVKTSVMLDVNPSIEIQLNKDDRVVTVEAKNEAAIIVLDNMDLNNTQINVAVNALIGSMLKFGYIKENANSVLLSVKGEDEAKTAALQKNLSDSIVRHLNTVNGAVISQQLSADEETVMLADQYKISAGKAALVKKIISENNHLLFNDLAGLSVNDLNLIIESNSIVAAGMEAKGNASDTDFIGDAAALSAALEHAGINESEIEKLKTEFDYEDGAMVYEIEFEVDSVEYEYEINAKTGMVTDAGRERD